MKKYLFLIILTVLLLGITVNIDTIEQSMAYTVTNVALKRENIEKTVVCTGTIYKTPQNDVYAKIFINENLVADVKAKQKAKITANALDGIVFTGTVLSLADEAETVKIGSISQTMVEGVVKIDASEFTQELRNGYTVSVQIIIKTDKNMLIVPYDAVLYENEAKYVYRITEDWAVKTKIDIIEETAKGAIVQNQTLTVGDRVVVDLEHIPKGKKYIRFSNEWESEKIG